MRFPELTAMQWSCICLEHQTLVFFQPKEVDEGDALVASPKRVIGRIVAGPEGKHETFTVLDQMGSRYEVPRVLLEPLTN